MTEAAVLDSECFQTTDGEIAIINLNSARLRSWSRFFQDPQQPGVAETVIEHEQLTAQFAGDLSALDRLESLARTTRPTGRIVARARCLIQAQIASMLHRFSDARHYLAQASLGGAPSADVKRLLLNVDQACGANLDAVLDERRKIAAKSGRLEDLVALGALLADLGEFNDADDIYRQALRGLPGCFAVPRGVGLLSARHALGRACSGTRFARAEHWYRKAIASLPGYVKARVHLAEIFRPRAGAAKRRRYSGPRSRAAIRRCSGGWPTC